MSKYNFKVLSNVMNSAIFSDILDDYDVDYLIRSVKPNIFNAKIMGRANTLKLRALNDGEDYKSIYDAFDTYKTVRSGEIIIVENEIPEFAYFGELNATIAMRCEAMGVIIGGVTRDAVEVQQLGLPVFSTGYSCADVLKRATMESHNKPICIDGVNIFPGSLIFADVNGVIVIPQNIEDEVLELAVKARMRESEILNKIINGIDAKQISNEDGGF